MNPILKLRIPSVKHFDALLQYMHTHDERQLTKRLKEVWNCGVPTGQQGLRDFAANVRYLGVVDDRIRACAEHVLLEDEP